MKLVNDKSLMWASGFLGGAAVFHFLPFIVRHQLKIGEVWLSNTNAMLATVVFGLLAFTAYKFSVRHAK